MTRFFLIWVMYFPLWFVVMIKLNHVYNMQQRGWNIICVQQTFVEDMDLYFMFYS